MTGEKEWRMEEAKKRRGEEARGGEAEEGRREGPRVHNPLTDSFVEWLTAQCATLEPEQRGAAMTVGIISPLTYSHHYPPSSPPPTPLLHHPPLDRVKWYRPGFCCFHTLLSCSPRNLALSPAWLSSFANDTARGGWGRVLVGDMGGGLW